MMTNEKNTKLLIDFFTRELSDEQKKEFLHKASSDPEFLKEFIKGIELEDAYQELLGDKDKKEGDGENPT